MLAIGEHVIAGRSHLTQKLSFADEFAGLSALLPLPLSTGMK